MKYYCKQFLSRGLYSAAGGPVLLAIIYGILGKTGEIVTLTPHEVCLGILTITLLAFVAGASSAVYQIERLPLPLAVFIHGIVLFIDYILIYLVNGWLESQWIPVLIFTGIFWVGYGLIWLFIYCTTRRKTNSINSEIKKRK